jgi:hypothetical protein
LAITSILHKLTFYGGVLGSISSMPIDHEAADKIRIREFKILRGKENK